MTRRVLAVLVVLASVVAGFQLAPGGGEVAQAAPSSCLPPLVVCSPASTAEAQVNATGVAFADNRADQPVRGFLQAHDHLWSYKGFGQGPFCGKTFDPGGITKAAVDCPEHSPFGIPAWFEQLASGQLPLTPHSTTGWPTFRDWPSASSATHNMSYYKGIERLWQAGVRVFVDDLVTNRGLCLIYTTKRAPCDEMGAIRAEAAEARAFEAWLDQQYGGPGKGWYRIVTGPAHARQVIAEGKMAVVLGIETSEPFGCGRNFGTPRCTQADIDRGLDEVHRLGVRSMFLCHKYDNALCGVRFDSGTNGVVVNAGNFVTTGQFWQAETCTGPRHDNPIPPADPGVLGALIANSDIDLAGLTLPIYPPAPHCNKLGLSDLGEYAIRGMMRRGMILELDHMSVRAADRALTILEQNDYPAAISSHDWMDTGYNQRLQNLGGIITGIGQNSASFVAKWRQTRATADPARPFAFGYGLDGNGLNSAMPKPGQNAAIQYPFTSYDGQVTLHKQVWGLRTWDFNSDGLAQQGMVPDWLESVRLQAGADGPALVDSMTRGAEAYLRMWEQAGG